MADGGSRSLDEGRVDDVRLTLVRDQGGLFIAAPLTVHVNDELVAELAAGERLELRVDPGEVRVTARTGAIRSGGLVIDCPPSSTFEVHFDLPRWRGSVATWVPWPMKAWNCSVNDATATA